MERYEALEREHLGCPEKKTGIYHDDVTNRTEDNDFMTELKAFKKQLEETPVHKDKIIVDYSEKVVELSSLQKTLIVDYCLQVSKGLFEDCEEFWDGMTEEQIDELYPAYKEASYRFVEALRQQILDTI